MSFIGSLSILFFFKYIGDNEICSMLDAVGQSPDRIAVGIRIVGILVRKIFAQFVVLDIKGLTVLDDIAGDAETVYISTHVDRRILHARVVIHELNIMV